MNPTDPKEENYEPATLLEPDATDNPVTGTSSDGTAVQGTSANGFGVVGTSTTRTGVWGRSTNGWGVHGVSVATAIHGRSTTGAGVWGASQDGNGVFGTAGAKAGVEGTSSSGAGVKGTGVPGVHGTSSSGAGVRGEGRPGVLGVSAEGTGVVAQGGVSGLRASFTSNRGTAMSAYAQRGYGLYATVDFEGTGVYGQGTAPETYAGYFSGRAHVTRTLTQGGGGFRIDHPADPENRYLTHSWVGSAEMKNVYDGMVVLDAVGRATVELPEWFEVLNEKFRYQLTPIGVSAPGLHVDVELARGQFSIGGGEPHMKVSWQITGVRRDAWAAANPVRAEEEKSTGERGYFLNPDLYGQPPERALMQPPAADADRDDG